MSNDGRGMHQVVCRRRFPSYPYLVTIKPDVQAAGMDMSRFAVEGGERSQSGVGEWYMPMGTVWGIPCPCQKKQGKSALARAKSVCLGMDTTEEIQDSAV